MVWIIVIVAGLLGILLILRGHGTAKEEIEETVLHDRSIMVYRKDYSVETCPECGSENTFVAGRCAVCGHQGKGV